MPEAAARAGGDARVVVLEAPGAARAPERSVFRLNGDVGRQIPLVGGFAARVPASRVAELKRSRGVRAVVADRRFALLSTDGEPVSPGTSLAVARDAIGASGASDAGTGVDVAVIDSGVAPLPAFAGRLVNGPDFSADGNDPEHAHLDGFGHGTHLAGIVAGGDTGDGFSGIAPGARVVNVKVADHEGDTSLSRLLAGIDWVVRNHDRGGLDIRVIELAFGGEVSGDYRNDPLAYAVERAWRQGVVVVAAAGNGGPETGALDSPAYDPFVIAAGASDTRATADRADDFVAEFSSRGSAERTPDVIAPGVGIVSLRVPGGLLDEAFPAARIGEGFFRGSGTSQSTAVTAGAVADLLSRRPDLGPDQVKALLRATAHELADVDVRDQGAGLLDVGAAHDAVVPAGTRQQHAPAKGGGPWRGASLGVELATEHPGMTANRWSANRWSANRWSANRWSANRWSANRWSANRWSANRWSANRWSANRWSANRWSFSDWG